MKRAAKTPFLSEMADRWRVVMEGETQTTLGEKLNISQGNIAKYLQGTIIPRSDVLLDLMIQKNVNPIWFLSGKGSPTLPQGYGISKAQAMSKASTTVRIPYGLSKEVAGVNERIQQLVKNDPDCLREIKAIISAMEYGAGQRARKS